MTGEQPASLAWVLRALSGIVGLGLVVTALVVVLRDELIRSWAEGRRDERRILNTQGLDAVKAGAVHPPAFVPVAVVLFVVMAMLIWVLAAFLRAGYNWARIALTVSLFFLAVGTIGGLRTGAPVVFTVLAIASFPIEAAAVFFLWHRDTSAHLRGRYDAPHESLAELS